MANAKSEALKTKSESAYHKDILVKHWGSGKPMKHEGGKYRVGKMSYGDYFLESHDKRFPQGRGEKSSFSKGTQWLEKHPDKKEHYRVNKLLSD